MGRMTSAALKQQEPRRALRIRYVRYQRIDAFLECEGAREVSGTDLRARGGGNGRRTTAAPSAVRQDLAGVASCGPVKRSEARHPAMPSLLKHAAVSRSHALRPFLPAIEVSARGGTTGGTHEPPLWLRRRIFHRLTRLPSVDASARDLAVARVWESNGRT